MNHSPTVRDQLAAFRHGVDHLDAAEFYELRAALADDAALEQQLAATHAHDALVRTAMHDVPVPVDLAERLLAQVAARKAASSDTASAELPTVVLPANAAPSTIPARRRWLGVLSGGLALTAVAVLGLLLLPGDQASMGPLTADTLAQLVEQCEAGGALADADRWQAASARGVRLYPIDKDIRVAPRRYQRFTTSSGPLVVYELTTATGGRARLFVLRSVQPCEVGGSPLTALSMTGQRQAGAWQRGGLVYVLVIDPRDARLADFVRIGQPA